MANAFRTLKHYRAREFFLQPVDWRDKGKVAALFDSILNLPVAVDADAVLWLNSWRELDVIIDEEYNIRYVEMTCDTESKEKAEAFQHFSQELMPVLMEKAQALKDKLLSTPLLAHRAKAEAPEFFRRIETEAKLFRKENIPLEVEVQDLCQEYQKISGAMTAEWKGAQVTMQALAREAEQLDRGTREAAFRTEWNRRLQDKQALDDLFDKMYILRSKIAKNAGFSNYRDYAFLSKHRYDYNANDCMKFHQAIKTYIVPLAQKQHQARKQKMNLKDLRIWDTHVDVLGEKPLVPFQNTDELVERVDEVIGKVDKELSGFYREMKSHNMFDLANRKGKAPGGYQTMFNEARMPFIFMNSVGLHRDVTTLLHESGHAFHSFLSRGQDIFQLQIPMEFCEVASMSMELIASQYLPESFGKEVAAQHMRQLLGAIPTLLLSVAMIDSFQHWIYTNEAGSNASARHQKWLELSAEYMPELDAQGIEEMMAARWHRVLHIFQMPFYYIEYGLAEFGALQFWQKYLDDPKDALRDYKVSLAAGGTLGLKDLFRRANLEWPMEAKAIQPLAALLDEKLSVYSSI